MMGLPVASGTLGLGHRPVGREWLTTHFVTTFSAVLCRHEIAEPAPGTAPPALKRRLALFGRQRSDNQAITIT